MEIDSGEHKERQLQTIQTFRNLENSVELENYILNRAKRNVQSWNITSPWITQPLIQDGWAGVVVSADSFFRQETTEHYFGPATGHKLPGSMTLSWTPASSIRARWERRLEVGQKNFRSLNGFNVLALQLFGFVRNVAGQLLGERDLGSRQVHGGHREWRPPHHLSHLVWPGDVLQVHVPVLHRRCQTHRRLHHWQAEQGGSELLLEEHHQRRRHTVSF